MPTAGYIAEEDADMVQVTPSQAKVKLENGTDSPSSSEGEDRGDLYPEKDWPSSKAAVDVKSTEQIKQELQEKVQSTVKRVKEQSDR